MILNKKKKNEKIINSLLDTDFYKFTMGQFIFKHYKDVPIEFRFKNRTSGVPLGKILDLGRIREEFEHLSTLSITPDERHYLCGVDEYGQRMFDNDYGQFLRSFKLSEYEVDKFNDELIMRFYGPWSTTSLWETFSLSIVQQLYSEYLLKDYSRFEQEVIFAEGQRRLAEKIKLIRSRSDYVFSEFGTRRRFSRDWQQYIIEVFSNEFPIPNGSDQHPQFLGTSNVLFAKKFGLVPMGTNAHELSMALSGIHYDLDEAEGRLVSQEILLNQWWEMYGEALSIFLSDTASSDYFFNEIVTPEMMQNWKGSRQDSGDPAQYIKDRIAQYHQLEIDPKTKMIICADGQNVPKGLRLLDQFGDKTKLSFGPGTDITNDLGMPTLSIVTKVYSAAGKEVAKLSDNVAKATGTNAAIDRLKRLINYDVSYEEECVV